MGNNPQNPIPSTFPKHCHKNLTFSKINPQQKTLQLKIPYNQHYHQWKWNLYPIQTYQKYLMLPKYFVDHGVHLMGCQNEENKKSFRSQLDILVGYQPYVYTLENQIMSRKFNDNFFTQKEIWKIVKSSLLALQCWNHAYNDIQIGGLVQKNILFNAEGQIKIVHHFSFPPEGLITYNNKVIQYETINPRNTITKGKTLENMILTNSLYTLGLTLLNMINVGNLFTTKRYDQNIQLDLLKISLLSIELKNVVLHLLEKRVPKKQEQLEQLILIARARCKQPTSTQKTAQIL